METRWSIVGLLVQGSLTVGEIERKLGVEQYAVSKNLRVLREVGIVVGERDRQHVVYSINPKIQRGMRLDLGFCEFDFSN